MRLFRHLTTATVLLLACIPGALANPGNSDDSVGGAPRYETATFSMFCYWTGEATLGQVEGVVASRIGHWRGNEIVQVDFDPEQTSLGALVEALERQRSFYSVVVGDESSKRKATLSVDPDDVTQLGGGPRFIEPKHTLRQRHPELYALGLTEEQAIALNSWSYFGGKMPEVLTREQEERLSSR